MLTDPFDQQLTDLLKTARSLPPPGWRSQALAALAGVRPRRHPNLLTFIIVAALMLLLAAGLFAAVRHFFYVEGTLQFHDVSVGPDNEGEVGSARFLSGELQWEIGDQEWRDTGDTSPVSDEVAFFRGWPSNDCDILKANLDGSDEVNLTEAAGVSGINCHPSWSPDGSMLSFGHCDPVEGLMPCEAGFHVWVMNADGTDAHRVTPEGSLPTLHGSWSPDGSRLLMSEYSSNIFSPDRTIGTDIWGVDIQVLPNVRGAAVYSPDGSMIAGEWHEDGEVDGEPGRWNQLRLTDADGRNPRVLLEQFVVYAAVEAHYPTDEMLERRPRLDWVTEVMNRAGPAWLVWSPTGEQIAFLAALPFDPDGIFFMNQVEVWVYDLTTDELTRITDDDIGQTGLSWK